MTPRAHSERDVSFTAMRLSDLAGDLAPPPHIRTLFTARTHGLAVGEQHIEHEHCVVGRSRDQIIGDLRVDLPRNLDASEWRVPTAWELGFDLGNPRRSMVNVLINFLKCRWNNRTVCWKDGSDVVGYHKPPHSMERVHVS
jgi:hypothetical protein